MGDRSNIAIVQQDGSRIYFYTHWAGTRIHAAAVHGLKSGRTRDVSYLARIIFSNLIRTEVDEETSYGISNIIQDNEHDILVIHPDYSRDPIVWLEGEDGTVATPKLSARQYVAVMDKLLETGSYPADDLIIERMKEAAGA